MFMRTFPPNLPRTCPFTNFVWTKMEKKKLKKSWFTYTQERLARPLLLEFVKIHFTVDTLRPVMGHWFATRRSCSLEQSVWCTRSLGPGNPISLVRFISFPQSRLQLPQVKTATRLTGRWNRSFFFKRLVSFHPGVI